jgi:hypothetical protein
MDDINKINETNNNVYLYLTKFIDIVNDTHETINNNINNIIIDMDLLKNKINESEVIFKNIISNLKTIIN